MKPRFCVGLGSILGDPESRANQILANINQWTSDGRFVSQRDKGDGMFVTLKTATTDGHRMRLLNTEGGSAQGWTI